MSEPLEITCRVTVAKVQTLVDTTEQYNFYNLDRAPDVSAKLIAAQQNGVEFEMVLRERVSRASAEPESDKQSQNRVKRSRWSDSGTS